MKEYRKYLLALAAIAMVAWLVSRFWIQLALIQGDSMKPAYRSGQLVLLNKNVENLNNGDVVAFLTASVKGILIKRIVAKPGDTVQIMEGTLYVNGKKETAFTGGKNIEFSGIAADLLVLGENEYFVLGDNVAYSKDSRYEEIGCIRQEDIIGKVIGRK